MIKKNYFIYLTAVAFLLLASAAVTFAQVAAVRGKVEFKKADGTTVPAAEVNVDVYRTDAKSKGPSAKTNKKGEFAFAGLLLGQTFMIVVSGPEIQAQAFGNVKAGMENLAFTVYAGDGKRPNEEEARQLLNGARTGAASSAGEGSSGSAQPAKLTPEEEAAAKKAKEEYDKKVAEVTAKNEKVKNINEVVNRSLNEGKTAFESKNYDVAIVKYAEGYNADPEFAGTAPVFLNNKGLSLRLRGYESYRKSVGDTANKDSLMASAKKDFSEAINDFQKSLEIVKNATPTTTDAKMLKDFESYRRIALAGLVETHRLMIGSRADQTRGKEAVAALEEYSAVETDAAAKLKAQILMADALRLAGNSADALPIYQKAYAAAPDNVDILGGMGLSLFEVGVSASNKEQMQEGLNMLERFSQTAPDTHPMKNDIKTAVDYLKTQEKLTPQKTTKPAPAKKKT